MSLLRDLIIESAAAGSTGAGSVANSRGTLFGGGAVDQEAEDKRKTTMLRRIGYFKVGDANKLKPMQNTMNANLRWREVAESTLSRLSEKAFDDSFDTSDVISKLDDAEKKADAGNDTTCFGMEDETGALVKVYVRDEQAEDFEHALATMLAGADEDADDDNSHGEIAEVLYQLKDKFDIVDVEWGVIEGDEEEEQAVEGEGELDPEAAGGEGGEGGEELEGDLGLEGEGEEGLEGGDETVDDAKSALQDVIGMMKADAEAKKAEAEARKAAAEAETAKYAITAAEQKVAQEEQILDMETHEADQKSAEKEAKTLAKLAKYRHTIRGNGNVASSAPAAAPAPTGGDDLDLEENEEQEASASEVSKEDLADLIFKHLQSN